MPSTTISRGNVLTEALLSVQMTPTQIAANASSTQTFSLVGALPTDYVDVFAPGAQTANVVVQGCWISSAGVMAVQFLNTSSVAVTPVSAAYSVNLVRAENTPLPSNMT